ncbi:transposase [Streptomyces sp. TRM70350]|uniref:transposase n=1 Tax=Streptomyces sp. TRM70350 TaxID=2856165 RepID=UPI00210FB72A|nr:transposase [Streptomyces sp. TRM70350]
MTDEQWAVVRDALPVPAWLEGRGGQPEGYCHRQMLDAIFYVEAVVFPDVIVEFPLFRHGLGVVEGGSGAISSFSAMRS